MDYAVLIIGLAALTQGVPYLISPKNARSKMRKWLKHDDLTYRAYGAIAFGFGMGILYIGLF